MSSATHSDELALLVDAVRDYAIFLLSPDGHINTWNTGAGRVFGYPAEEIIGEHFSRFYPDDLRAARHPEYELTIAARDGRIEDEGWRVRKDGTLFWANTIITVLRDDDGRLRGFAKVTRDLTERRNATLRLAESQEIFRLLVESLRDYAVFMLNPEGHVSTWNLGAERIKGYAPNEIIGKHFSVFYPAEDIAAHKPARLLERALKEGSVEDEGYRVRKDGTHFCANVVITAVRDADGVLRGFAKVTRDMTEKKIAEDMRNALFDEERARLYAEEKRAIAEARYAAEQDASRAKDEFLMTLSHELRTPLTAILGWARLLTMVSPNETDYREALASILRSATLQKRLIDDVLDVSRILAGKMSIAPELADGVTLIREVVDSMRVPIQEKGIAFRVDIPNNLGMISVDGVRLQQIVSNLLSNALKFTPRGGEIAVRAKRAGGEIEIVVRDTGVGVDPEFLPHIFERFRQAEHPLTRAHGGLGLGLSIVRYLVEAHHGTVSAESEGRGKGSTFTVTMPVAFDSDVSDREREPRVAMETLRGRLTGIDILVVEDNGDTRNLLRHILEQAGAEVRSAESAEAALEEIEARVPQIVLTDIAMPRVNGWEFLRKLRERNDPKLRVIALSAFGRSASMEQSDVVFDRFLAKPIDPFTLVDEVAEVAKSSAAVKR